MFSFEFRYRKNKIEQLSMIMKSILFLLCTFFMTSCNAKFDSKSASRYVVEKSGHVVGDFFTHDDEGGNFIELINSDGDVIHSFNYIPAYFESFSRKLIAGESYILGKLPKQDKNKKIIAWNDELHPFELFIATNGSYHLIVEDIGVNLLLVGDFEGHPWVYSKSKQELWRIPMKGEIAERYLIPIENFGGYMALYRNLTGIIQVGFIDPDRTRIFFVNQKTKEISEYKGELLNE